MTTTRCRSMLGGLSWLWELDPGPDGAAHLVVHAYDDPARGEVHVTACGAEHPLMPVPGSVPAPFANRYATDPGTAPPRPVHCGATQQAETPPPVTAPVTVVLLGDDLTWVCWACHAPARFLPPMPAEAYRRRGAFIATGTPIRHAPACVAAP